MPHAVVSNYSHIVFGPKRRRGSISSDIEEELSGYIGGVLKTDQCRLIKAGGMPDHIHLLVKLHSSVSIAKCVQKIKSNSSRWIKSKGVKYKNFKWQDGYAAFSVSYSQLPRVKEYIENQKKHHRKRNFKEELRALFAVHNLEFDEEEFGD